MAEINEAANVIIESIDPEAQVIFGAVVDETLSDGQIKVTVIATGFDQEDPKKPMKAFEKEEIQEPTIDELKKDAEKKRLEQEQAQLQQEAVDKKKDEFIRNVDSDDDEFELPTFIRNKLNK